MGLTAHRSRIWRARTRSGVAVVVLAAWFATLLVAAPMASPASAAPADPSTIAITGPAVSPDADSTPTWTFTLPADDPGTPQTVPAADPSDTATATIAIMHRGKCFVGTTAPTAGDYVDCATPTGTPNEYTFTPPALTAAGDYTFYVHDVETTTTTTTTQHADASPDTVDVVGPTSVAGTDATSAVYTFDTDGPTLAFDSEPTSPGTSPTPSWSWTAGADTATVDCSFTDGTTTTTPACTTSFSPTLTDDGTYNLTVTAKDAFGHPTVISSSYQLLTAGAPGVSVSAATGSGTSPTWTLTPPAGTTPTGYSAVLSGPSVPAGAPIAVAADPTTHAGTYSPTLAPANDGTWTLTVTATVDGRPSAPGSANYLLDGTDPVVAITPASSATPNGSPTPGWTVNVTDADATPTVTCAVTPTPSNDPGSNCAAYATWSAPSQGTWTLTATAVDDAGNTGTGTSAYTYDVAPAAPVVVTPATGNGANVTWTVSTEPTATVTCSVAGPGGFTATPTCAAGSNVAVTVTLPAGPGVDGNYVLTVDATDAGGTTTTVATAYVLDRTPPPTPTFDPSGSSGSQNTAAVSWPFTASGGAVKCRLFQGPPPGSQVGPPTNCTTPFSTTLGAEGEWWVRVIVTDAAGNASTADSAHVIYDTTAPAQPTLTRTSASPTSSRATTWTIGTTEPAGYTLLCSWTGPAGYTAAETSCPAAYSFTVPATNGTYTLSVVVRDAAGNRSPARTGTMLLDDVAPVVTFTSPPASPRNTATVTWTTTVSESSVQTECQLVQRTTGPDNILEPWTTASCGRSVTRTLSAGDGSYFLQVRDTDAAGNVDVNGTTSADVVLDTTAPGSPTVSGPTGYGQNPAVSWTVTPPAGPVDPTTTYLCRLVRDNNAAAAIWVPCDSDPLSAGVVFTTTLPADGDYRLDVQAQDLAGNVSAAIISSTTYTLDRVAPAAPTVSTPTYESFDTAPVWTITGEAGATFSCSWTTTIAPVPAGMPASGACSTGYQVTLPADGSYTLHVTQTDQALNTSATSTDKTYVLDTQAPAAPVVTGPTGTAKNTAVSYSFTAEAGSTAECRLTYVAGLSAGSPAPIGSGTWAPCTSAWAVTLAQGDGRYRAEVRVTDVAGNVSTTGLSTIYVLDTTGPSAASFTGEPTGTDNVPGVTWDWTGETPTTGSCQLLFTPAGGSTASVVAGPLACNTGTYSTTLSAGDGFYQLTVRLTDPWGNAGALATSIGYTLDLTAPGAPTVTGPSVTDNDTTADYAIVGPVETNATAECKLTRDATVVVSDWSACTLPRTITLPADGSYVLQVRLTDQYGNLGAAGASPAYLLDTQDPALPDLHGPTGTANTTAVQYVFTSEAASVAQCRLLYSATGAPAVVGAGTWSSCASPWNVTLSLGDGQYQAEVHVTDAAGNVSPDAQSEIYTLDTTGPVAATFTAQPTGTANVTVATWTWTGETPTTGSCRLLYTPVGGSTASVVAGPLACNAKTYSTTLTAGDGFYQLTVQLTDPSGNAGAVVTSTGYTLDTTPPGAPTVSGPSVTDNDTTADYAITSTVEANATTECKLTRDATVVVSDWASCTLPRTITLVGDGSYVLQVRLTDQYGNLGAAGASPAYLLDTQAPALPDLHGPTGTASTPTAQYVFTAEAGSAAECRLLYSASGTPAVVGAGAWSSCASPWNVTLSLGDGQYQAEVHVTDAAGNVSPDAQSEIYTLDTTGPVAATFTAQPTGTANVMVATWLWTGETPSTGTCRLLYTPVGGSTASVVAGPSACDAGTYSTTLISGDGFYQLTVQLTDPSGNAGAVVTSTGYNLDTSPPGAPTVSGPTVTSNDTTADYAITSTVEANATSECKLTRDTTVVVSDWASCTLPRTITLAGDGSYVLQVRLTDQYGNLGAAGASSAYLLDTQAPAVPDLHGPTGTASTPTAQYVFTAEAGSAAECRLLYSASGIPAVVGAGAWSSCASPWNQFLTQGDGNYQAEVHVTDAAGNVSPDAQSEIYTLDTTGPLAPSFTAQPTGTANVKSVTWTWTGETPTTGTCRLLFTPVGGTASVVAGPLACNAQYSTSLSAGDGFYQLTVQLTDPSGNAGALATSVGYNLDTSPPGAPTVTGPTGTSNDTTADYAITSTVEANATSECKLTRDTTVVVSDWASCTLPRTITLAGDGSYVLQVRLTDQYGNLGAAGASSAYLLDTQAPAVPDLHGPTGSASTTTAQYVFTAEAGSAAECRLLFVADGAAGAPAIIGSGTWSSCTSPWNQFLTQGDGRYQAEVHVTDAAGNVSPDAQSEIYTLDTTGPSAVSFTAEPTGTANVKSVTWTWTGETPTTGSCRLLYTPVGGSTASVVAGPLACNGQTYTTTLAAGDGFYQLTVQLTDPSGNAGVLVASTGYTLDTTPPAAPTVSGPSVTSNDTTADYAITSTVEANATSECKLTRDTTVVVSDWASCTLPRTITLVGDGSYVLQVRLTDQYGNLGAAGASPAYLLDTHAPALPDLHGPTGTANTTTAQYVFTAEAGSAAECRLLYSASGIPAVVGAGAWSSCASPWNVTLSLGDGQYQAEVHVTDAAGNVSPDAQSEIYTLDTTGPVAATFTAQPTGTANVMVATWLWTGETPSTGTCRLLYTPVGGSTASVVAGPSACDAGTYSTTLISGDGFYQLTVQLTDPSGNAGALATSVGYNLDTSPPGAPTVTGPTGTSNDTTADYAITSTVEANATSECKLTRDTTVVVSDWASCTLPRTITLVGDGSYVLQVRLTDQYGNLGAAGASPAFLLDTKLPTVPVVTPPASPSSNAAPVFTFVTDSDTTTTCRVTRGSVVAIDTTPCTGSFTAALGGQPDGDYVLAVTATDPATNTSTGTSSAYTFDTTAPLAPVVTGPAGPSQTRNPLFSWTGENGARAECSLQEKAGAAGTWVRCTGPYAPTLSTDGSWVLSVRLVDAAGNISDPGQSGAYLLDTTPPITPTVTAPPSPGRDLAPSWSGVIEEGSKAECRLTGPSQLGNWSFCTLPVTTPIGGDGTYTFEVRTTDIAGNTSQVGSATYTLDTTAPAAPVVVQPTGPGRNRTPNIAFTSEAGTTGSCRLTHGTTVLSEAAPCSSPTTLNVTGLPDGAYTLTVRAVDAAGNIGPAGTATYVLDTTAPAAPTYTLIPGSPSSDRAPAFAFNAELGTTASCKVTVPSGTVRDLACASPLTLDLSGAADGDYVLALRSTDPAGNVSAAATTTYHLDSTAPAAPKVVGPTSPGSIRNPVWKISSGSPAECRLLRGTTVFKDWAACGTSYAADLFTQPDAVYILEARVIGTTAATMSRYRLDTTGPAAAQLVAPPSPSTDRRPTWAIVSADTTVRAECRVMVFTGVLKDWAPCAVSPAGSLFVLDLNGLGDGTYSLQVRLTDAANNLGPTATSDFVLDTSAPSAVGVTAPASPDHDTTPTWTLTSAAGVKLECRLSTGQKVISDFAPCTGAFTADLTGLGDATYTLTVHALSAAGTPGPDTTSSYLLDTTAAGAPGTLTGPTGPSRDRAPKWTFSLSAGTTALCKVTIGGKVFREGPCTSPFTLDLSNAADGTYTLSVRLIDAAGNSSTPATAGYILKTSPPPAPVLTMQPGSPSSTTDPVWGFSLFHGTTAQCRLLQSGTALEDWTACGVAGAANGTVAALLSGKPDGRYTMQVRAIDIALNTSSAVSGDYVFDRTAAPLAVFTETPKTPNNDLTPTWGVSAPAASDPTTPAGTAALVRAAALTGTPQIECRLTTPHGAGAWEPCSGRYVARTNGDGTYLLEVRAFDSTGERGPASSSSYLLDTRVPPAPKFIEPLPPTVGNDAEVVWSWADDENLVQCHLLRNGASLGGFTNCDTPFVANIGRQGEATYTIEARAVDAAGNVSPVSTTSYRYDITPPPAAAFTSRPAARGSSSSVTWTFAVPVDTQAVCVVTRNGTVVSEGSCAGAFTLDLHGQLPATWALSVHLVDAAGNAGPSTVGNYTLLSAIARGRVGSPGGSGVPGTPGTPGTSGGGGAPGAGGGAPGVTNPAVDNEQPRPGAAIRIPQTIKKGIKKATRVVAGIPGAVPGTDVPKAVKNVLRQTITKPQLPLALFVIVLLFLLVQNRIDRRDPKLAAAPANAEPELTFGPILRPGGATA